MKKRLPVDHSYWFSHQSFSTGTFHVATRSSIVDTANDASCRL
jgi:hypothetical protein